ncbi:hypothetical protein [Hoyosella subflava]|uniref:Secreted protein n=1 Tax=Hoyosella subflava (strain DSM 45089 / JCM 17490 / NBRC 109087 / DQS3-9A1) TaxID=443218 RepID=F6EJB9_HOYSD|nr:hypothetical protein [Hoyosella subflava]AEF42535.1 hypothetical protein AS9A_4101 [Hoyosella subflava DQS3-9A1]
MPFSRPATIALATAAALLIPTATAAADTVEADVDISITGYILDVSIENARVTPGGQYATDCTVVIAGGPGIILSIHFQEGSPWPGEDGVLVPHGFTHPFSEGSGGGTADLAPVFSDLAELISIPQSALEGDYLFTTSCNSLTASNTVDTRSLRIPSSGGGGSLDFDFVGGLFGSI